MPPGQRTLPAARAPTSSFEVRTPAEHRYAVHYEPDLLDRYGTHIAGALTPHAVVILTDRRVGALYSDALVRSFQAAGIEPGVITIAEGERSKSLRTFERVLARLRELGFDRRGLLVNFGGGVVSDLGGFVASAYMRGVAYANFSTSLLGQVDACIGGKVAVNARHAKNFVGAFYHPRHVAGDPCLLRTLSLRDFRSGLAEVIKVGIIGSEALLATLEREEAAIRACDPVVLTEIIGTAARLKMERIAADPYERDLRRPLNFGHTLGHPIETELAYKRIRHGEAVAIGMGVATAIARRRGLLDEACAERIFALLARYDLLGFSEPIRPEPVIEHVRSVRLIRGNHLYFVLPAALGRVEIVDDLTNADLVRGFEDYEAIVRRWRG